MVSRSRMRWLDLDQLPPRPRLETGVGLLSVAATADFQQLGDFVEGEPEPLRGLDDPQQGDGVGRVEPVAAGGADRLGEQAAAFVVAQGLVTPGSVGDLAGPQALAVATIGPPAVARWSTRARQDGCVFPGTAVIMRVAPAVGCGTVFRSAGPTPKVKNEQQSVSLIGKVTCSGNS